MGWLLRVLVGCTALHLAIAGSLHRQKRQTETLFDCDFASGNLCEMVQSNSDNFQWSTSTDGTTPTGETGPSGTSHRTFIFIEATDHRNQNAVIKTKQFSASGSKKVSFAYHARGRELGVLTVTAQPSTLSGSEVFKFDGGDKSEDVDNAWKTVERDLPAGTVSVEFKVQTADHPNYWSGDYALDDIRVTSTSGGGGGDDGSGSSSFSCDLTTTCNMNLRGSGSDFAWATQTGATDSGHTGPYNGRGGGNDKYAFIESSNRGNGQKAYLETPNLSTGAKELKFYYYARGDTLGDLIVHTGSRNGPAVWTWSARNEVSENKWKEATVDLNSDVTRVVFEAKLPSSGNSYSSDFAIDDIDIKSTDGGGGGEGQTYVDCGFESSICDFVQSGDNRWKRTNQRTPTSGTGPEGAKDGSFYIFVEASDSGGGKRNGKYRIETKSFAASGQKTVTFDYHAWGNGLGNLKVIALQGQTEQTSWEFKEKVGTSSEQWRSASVSLPDGTSSVVFEIQLADSDNFWSSDFALDNIKVFSGDGGDPGPVGPGGGEGPGTADVVFVLDSSGSVGSENFNRQKQFVKDVVNRINLGENNVHVGVIRYSNKGEMMIKLNQYWSKSALNSAIDGIRYVAGASYTAAGLKALTEQIYTENGGDRSGAPDIAYFMIDSKTSVNPEETLDAAIAVRERGIDLKVVAVGNDVDDKEIEMIADDDANIVKVSGFGSLGNVRDSVSSTVDNQGDNCRDGPCRNGGSCTDGFNTFTCQCTDGWSGSTCNTRCDNLLDIAILLDTSGSIPEADYRKAKKFVADYASDFDIGGRARFGMVTFGSDIKTEFRLDANRNMGALRRAIERVPYRGGATNTAQGLQTIRLGVFDQARNDAKKVAIVITDGIPTVQAGETFPQARLLRESGVHVIAIGVGQGVDQVTLKGIASDPDDQNVFTSENFDNLPNLKSNIASLICSDGNQCSNNPCRNGAQCIDGFNTYTCVCRDEWSGRNCDQRCSNRMDVTILLDSSGSIGEDNFYDIIKNLQELVRRLRSDTNVGFITFSDEAQERFRLGQYPNKDSMLGAMGSIAYTAGATNTGAGLRMAQNMYGRAGDRGDADNMAIVMTDGISTVDPETTCDRARDLRNRNVRVVAVGIGEVDSQRRNELNCIATDPNDDNLILIQKFEDIPNRLSEIVNKVCG